MARFENFTSYALAGVLVLVLYFYQQYDCSGPTQVPSHRIDLLIQRAKRSFSEISSARTHSLATTVAAYTSRRHRPPPPGFDEWYHLASQHDAVIVESFWDPIYEDLDTFVDFSTEQLSAMAYTVATTPSPLIEAFLIDNGTVFSTCEPDNLPCLQVQAMLGRIAQKLPKLMLPFNGHASPRVLADSARQDVPLPNDTPLFTIPRDRQGVMQRACSANSSWASFPGAESRREVLDGALGGSAGMHGVSQQSSLVEDSQQWRDVCLQPWLVRMHGALIRPNSLNITTRLLPIFSPAKIAGIETAIRYPDTIYWAQEPGYHAGETLHVPWKAKLNKAFWRGSNTGGGHGPNDWHNFHRHRFVALTNTTYLQSVKEGRQRGWAEQEMCISDRMIQLNQEYIDVGFSTIRCRDDSFRSENQPCSYLDAHFHVLPSKPLDEILSTYRYLFDIDGNSYSGRFNSLLMSEAVVLKATIFHEWHDSRLVPWLHFVPVSNHFGEDLWDVLDFFLANEDHADWIARSARKWALQVLRPVDMELYLLRLLLEWSRLVRPMDST